jgi:hypothetical protein
VHEDTAKDLRIGGKELEMIDFVHNCVTEPALTKVEIDPAGAARPAPTRDGLTR